MGCDGRAWESRRRPKRPARRRGVSCSTNSPRNRASRPEPSCAAPITAASARRTSMDAAKETPARGLGASGPPSEERRMPERRGCVLGGGGGCAPRPPFRSSGGGCGGGSALKKALRSRGLGPCGDAAAPSPPPQLSAAAPPPLRRDSPVRTRRCAGTPGDPGVPPQGEATGWAALLSARGRSDSACIPPSGMHAACASTAGG